MIRAIGIDVGGTNIKSILVSIDKDNNLTILEKNTYETKAKLGRDAILSTIINAIKDLDPNHADFIGVGSAGTIDFNTGNVIYATQALPGFTGLHLKELLTKAIGKEVVVINDAEAAALGELHYSNTVSDLNQNVLFITLGTGLGSAIVSNASNVKDIQLGHYELHKNGRECLCGNLGCSECYVSATGIRRTAQEKDLEMIFKSNDPKMVNARHSFYKDFIDTLNFAIQEYSIDTIIVGGGVIDMRRYWWDEFIIEYRKVLSIPIKFAQLGNKAGTLGAIYVALNKEKINKEV